MSQLEGACLFFTIGVLAIWIWLSSSFNQSTHERLNAIEATLEMAREE